MLFNSVVGINSLRFFIGGRDGCFCVCWAFSAMVLLLFRIVCECI